MASLMAARSTTAGTPLKYKVSLEIRWKIVINYLREILKNNACWTEWDLDIFLGIGDPVKDLFNI